MNEEKKLPSAEGPPAKPLPSPPIDPQYVLTRLKDPQTLSKINYILAQHGVTTSKPWLRLEMEATPDQQSLELEPDDLQKLFSAFGPVENIVVSPHQRATAMVLFKDIVSAYLAQQALHNYYVPAYNSRLSIKWMVSDEPGESVPQERNVRLFLPPVEVPPPGHEKVPVSTEPQYYAPQPYPLTEHMKGNENMSMSTAKYTCRFDIQIANDKEFQVARKLIGAKGSNMKRILDLCSKGCTCPVQDVIKLRLRGKGSGFKEGPNQQESDDPLHLCISSRFYDKYVMARQLAKELILDVYEDYKKFCERTGKEVVNLQIKLIENVSGNRGRRPQPHGKMSAGVARPHGMYYGGQPAGPQGYYYEEGPRGNDIPYYPGSGSTGGYQTGYYGYGASEMYRPSAQYADPYGQPPRGYQAEASRGYPTHE